jgi:hypothetical protein
MHEAPGTFVSQSLGEMADRGLGPLTADGSAASSGTVVEAALEASRHRRILRDAGRFLLAVWHDADRRGQ